MREVVAYEHFKKQQDLRFVYNVLKYKVNKSNVYSGPGVNSASNRNEYRVYFLGVMTAVA